MRNIYYSNNHNHDDNTFCTCADCEKLKDSQRGIPPRNVIVDANSCCRKWYLRSTNTQKYVIHRNKNKKI